MATHIIPFKYLNIDTTYYFSTDLYDNVSATIIDSKIKNFLSDHEIKYKVGDYIKFDWMKDAICIFDGTNFVPI